MTIREFYQSVIDSNINDELTNKASELLSALDARNEKRKSTDSKEKKEAAARRDKVLGFLTENKGQQFTRDALSFALDITPGQAQAACKALADAIVKTEVKIDKARKVVYSIAE